MVIHIRLSDRKTANTDDPLGRSWYGYDPEATPAQLWENNRGDWRLSAERVAAERWAALSYKGQVVLVAELGNPAYKDLPGTTPPKKALFGRVLPEGHPVRQTLAQTQVVYSSRNAIQYDPAFDVAEPIEADSSVALDSGTADRPGAAGQGLQMDAEVRKAIEDAAQDRLMSYFRDRSWAVTDTRQNCPYDAVADKGTERIYLEAKGTQSRGDSVIVTRNEINHARQHSGACVMGVWSDMKLVDGVVDRGSGKFRVIPFSPNDQDLRPRDFDWVLPGDPAS